jgi:hypothetical protein
MKQGSLVDATIIEAPARNRSPTGTSRYRIVRLNTEAGIVWIAALFPKSTIKPQLPQPQVTVTLAAF